MLPAGSAAGPAPAIQKAPREPLGVTFSTAVCASVVGSYAMIQPVYGSMSQCEVHAVISRAVDQQERRARSRTASGSNGDDAAGTAGAAARERRLNVTRAAEQLGARSSTSSACSRWT